MRGVALYIVKHGCLLLQRSHCTPQLPFRGLELRRGESLWSELVSNVAAKVADLWQIHLSHRAAAFWAGESGELGFVPAEKSRVVAGEHVHIGLHSCLVRFPMARPGL